MAYVSWDVYRNRRCYGMYCYVEGTVKEAREKYFKANYQDRPILGLPHMFHAKITAKPPEDLDLFVKVDSLLKDDLFRPWRR